MGDVHCLLVMILVLYFPLRVKTGALKNGDISSDVTTKKTDPFKAVDMINLFRWSALCNVYSNLKKILMFIFLVIPHLEKG